MTNLVRCDSCQGRKILLCLGGITRSCPACRGVGWIEGEDKELEEAVSEKMDMAKPKKKPGRKPKITPAPELHCE